jgi:hypothetical protein
MSNPQEEPHVLLQSIDRLPNRGQRVIVVCKNFRCLGILDAEGIWRDTAHREPLPNVVGWIPLR